MASNGASPEAFVVDACRTPIGRYRGVLSGVRPDDLGAVALRALLDRNPPQPPHPLEDLIFRGAKHARADKPNLAPKSAQLAGVPNQVGG